MSTETIKETSSQTPEVLDWEPPMPPTDLIFDDGEPLETNRHRIAMAKAQAAEARVEQEQQRAELLAARLRELGGDPNAI